MAALLNRARHVLLDDDRRAEYDEILGAWEGPISSDGTPAVTTTRILQAYVAGKSPDEVEAFFADRVKLITDLTGYNPGRLAFLESLIEKSGGEIDEALRAEYEDALLQRDRVLALEEAERSRLLGLPDIQEERYVAALGYGQQVEQRVDRARTGQVAQLRRSALGGVGTRLALLAGENTQAETASNLPAATVPELPGYYEDQAARVIAIANERERINQGRLANFRPGYPEAELQTEFRKDIAIGVAGSVWLGAKIDPDALHAEVAELPDSVKELLGQGDFKAAIAQGFNVLTFDPHEHIAMQDLVTAAIEKYMAKYGLTG